MINVTCKLKNEYEKGHSEMLVKSVSETYDQVDICVGDAVIRVYADDLIKAAENCSNTGCRRRGRRLYIPETTGMA